MQQRDFFSRGKELKLAKQTWIDKTLEKTIVKVIRDGLVACRIPNWLILARVPCAKCGTWSAEPPDKGISDIAGIVPPDLFDIPSAWGRPLFIEVKRPKGGREGLEQKSFIDERRKHGAIAFFARGWDDVAENLTKAGVRIIPEDLRFKPREDDHVEKIGR